MHGHRNLNLYELLATHNSVQLGEVLGSVGTVLVTKCWYGTCYKGGLTDIMPNVILKKSFKQLKSQSET